MLKKILYSSITVISAVIILIFLLVSTAEAATLTAGYNDNNGDVSGYLDYSYTKGSFSGDVGLIHKDGLTSTEINGIFKDNLNSSYDMLVRVQLINNPRLNITTLSTKCGLDYILLLDEFTAFNAGYGLDAMGVSGQKTLFSVYYDLGVLINLDNFTLKMGTFGNGKLRKYTAEAGYKFSRLKTTEAGLRYTLTEFQGVADYMTTAFIKSEI